MERYFRGGGGGKARELWNNWGEKGCDKKEIGKCEEKQACLKGGRLCEELKGGKRYGGYYWREVGVRN